MKKILLLTIFILTNCNTTPVKEESSDLAKSEAVYQSCIETFKDVKKCEELSQKTKIAREKEDKKNSLAKVELTEEQEKSIWIREKLKNKFMSKSKLSVIETFGEPEESFRDGSGREYMIYRKPISRYSKNHDPDIEIRFIILRDQISEIKHTSPPSTPSSFDLFKKLPKN
ncbi:MAG: hypothetical protein SFU98_13260 [Leptospiraceae bacterium]|nr:hypothetical protein [Leptospiraceae bacterium]